MAVTLPSDLVLDVMRNADPSRVRATSARLIQKPGTIDGSGPTFSGVLGQVKDASISRAAGTADLIAEVMGAADAKRLQAAEMDLAAWSGGDEKDGAASEVYRSFEQMVLRNLFESMLPDKNSGIYGTDMSAGIWRSMAADQFAEAFSRSGSAGIAGRIAAPDEGSGPGQETMRLDEWPYYAAQEIRGFTG